MRVWSILTHSECTSHVQMRDWPKLIFRGRPIHAVGTTPWNPITSFVCTRIESCQFKTWVLYHLSASFLFVFMYVPFFQHIFVHRTKNSKRIIIKSVRLRKRAGLCNPFEVRRFCVNWMRHDYNMMKWGMSKLN